MLPCENTDVQKIVILKSQELSEAAMQDSTTHSICRKNYCRPYSDVTGKTTVASFWMHTVLAMVSATAREFCVTVGPVNYRDCWHTDLVG